VTKRFIAMTIVLGPLPGGMNVTASRPAAWTPCSSRTRLEFPNHSRMGEVVPLLGRRAAR
jgi:hypothetical protein